MARKTRARQFVSMINEKRIAYAQPSRVVFADGSFMGYESFDSLSDEEKNERGYFILRDEDQVTEPVNGKPSPRYKQEGKAVVRYWYVDGKPWREQINTELSNKNHLLRAITAARSAHMQRLSDGFDYNNMMCSAMPEDQIMVLHYKIMMVAPARLPLSNGKVVHLGDITDFEVRMNEHVHQSLQKLADDLEEAQRAFG